MESQELITQITLIREKASEAEAIVKTITKDIQRLDVAKRNLTGTMTAVKRWTMLSEHWTEENDRMHQADPRARGN